MVIIDTNVVIEYLRGNAKIASVVDTYVERSGIAITSLSRYELLQRFYKDQALLSFLADTEVYAFDKRASDKAAELWHKLKSKGKMVDDIDLLIASVALSNGEELLTMDNSFKNIDGNITIITK